MMKAQLKPKNLIVVENYCETYPRLGPEHLRIRTSGFANCALIDRQPSRPSTG